MFSWSLSFSQWNLFWSSVFGLTSKFLSEQHHVSLLEVSNNIILDDKLASLERSGTRWFSVIHLSRTNRPSCQTGWSCMDDGYGEAKPLQCSLPSRYTSIIFFLLVSKYLFSARCLSELTKTWKWLKNTVSPRGIIPYRTMVFISTAINPKKIGEPSRNVLVSVSLLEMLLQRRWRGNSWSMSLTRLCACSRRTTC